MRMMPLDGVFMSMPNKSSNNQAIDAKPGKVNALAIVANVVSLIAYSHENLEVSQIQ